MGKKGVTSNYVRAWLSKKQRSPKSNFRLQKVPFRCVDTSDMRAHNVPKIFVTLISEVIGVPNVKASFIIRFISYGESYSHVTARLYA